MFDRSALSAALQAHGRAVRVVITEVKGSAPREVGAAMLVWADADRDGGQSGTIGGGALEYAAAARARGMMAAGGVRYSEVVPLGPNLGQCCGGAVRLLWEVYTEVPDISDAYARPVSNGAGQMPLAIARAQAAARQGQPIAPALHQGWFIEPAARARHPVWIWGAGHVGRAIVSVMAPLPDVAITWVDTDLARFPVDIPTGVTALPAADITAAIDLTPPLARHIIVTFSHALDLALCDGLLRRGFGTCGVIGSATKWARFSQRLAAMGHTRAEIARIDCPIGDPALGKHPQAIAIGVAACMMGQMAAAPNLEQEARA
jgi:xanthine dehydrogenase accessory factor